MHDRVAINYAEERQAWAYQKWVVSGKSCLGTWSVGLWFCYHAGSDESRHSLRVMNEEPVSISLPRLASAIELPSDNAQPALIISDAGPCDKIVFENV